MKAGWIAADWGAPPSVRALCTTRAGGTSAGSYASLNLGAHVGDNPTAVAENRARLARTVGLPSPPRWLHQVHGTTVVDIDAVARGGVPSADAAVTRTVGAVLAVLTADCLPVTLAACDGSVIGIAHAGWRGLAGGVIEATLAAMAIPSRDLLAWLGPCIGPRHYEVGGEVRAAFAGSPGEAEGFHPCARAGHWLCDLAGLARARLRAAGLNAIAGGERDTFPSPEDFYSFRRDGATGRMASLIWLKP
ncbi:MAG: peptidoglycan editing factor PgeF [Gammaproteobacteria bacterium]